MKKYSAGFFMLDVQRPEFDTGNKKFGQNRKRKIVKQQVGKILNPK